MYERQRGDDLLSNDKRLKYKWKWSRVASGSTKKETRNWTHFQSSHSKIGDWSLSAIQWHTENDVCYEARVYYGDHQEIISKDCYNTRLKAQIGAEKLLKEWVEKEYKLIFGKEL